MTNKFNFSNQAANLELVEPNERHEMSFLEGLREFDQLHEKHAWMYGPFIGFEAELNFKNYVNELNFRCKVPEPNHVKCEVFWAKLNAHIVGRIALRHTLNKSLARVGGHIGYIVRPSFRNQGIATAMLQILLLRPKSKAIGQLLLTCDKNNVASQKTIEKNGGILNNNLLQLKTSEQDLSKLYYWIKLDGT